MNTLQKKIMRRIYYAYAIRVGTNPALLHGLALLAMLIALSYFVSIDSVLYNLSHVEVGHFGVFLYNAITNTEAWTLLILGGFIFTMFSLRVKLHTPVLHKKITA